jgi:hypothetical protein
MEYTEFMKQKNEIKDLSQAGVRTWGVVLSHLLCAPLASVYYACKTSHWTPTLAATGVALLATPLAIVDFGLTLTFVPPVTSGILIITNSNKKRNQYQIISPEQADMVAFSKLKTDA